MVLVLYLDESDLAPRNSLSITSAREAGDADTAGCEHEGPFDHIECLGAVLFEQLGRIMVMTRTQDRAPRTSYPGVTQ